MKIADLITKLFGDLFSSAVICRSIIDNNDFDILIGLFEGTLNRTFLIVGAIKNWDNNAN
jgi:hypothetical protein